MDRMIHLNLRAMQGVLNRQTAIAHNMANADTTGFKAEIVTAQAKYLEGEGLQSRATVNEYVLTADLNPG
ncbi:flagellar biosynthesis protein FlgF, partial [Candidatus Peregrinibacteria bacterium CG11_big_fil_rev_8_21_14_0_20_41_10]